MRTNKNTSKIILAVTVAILATMISYSTFSNMRNQMNEQQKIIDSMQKAKPGGDQSIGNYAYAVATTNLKAGEIVSDQDVDFQQFDIENKSAFDNRSDVVNKVLLKDISTGETFTNAHIAQISNDDVSLRDGYRALTLPTDNFQGRSDNMKPGTFVDIYSTIGDSSWILENVRIISFESGKTSVIASPETTIMNASAITFEVSASDISSFISNISKGKLMLVTRNQNDRKVVHKKTTKTRNSSYSASSYTPLPYLPADVPISNFPGTGNKHNSSGNNFSALPQPIQPPIQQQGVEVIEANVKSKVMFN